MKPLLALLMAFIVTAPARAEVTVTSPGPDKVAVTVYRAPHGGEMELGWLNGFAMVSETRRVSLPSGISELRFEGVTGGLVPQSAVVSLPDGTVLEKNRDAKLLSPGTLLDSYLGRRVQLRRTSKATGAVREQEAVVRASGDGVVLQTESGFEALRCTGLSETLLPPDVPATLPAKPTLSVQVRSDRPVEGEVRLTYLSSDFDWRAHYVATLSPDQRSLSLFAWLTLANGDETSFANADTMAVAGRLNREETERLQPEMRPIQLTCWPQQRTHQIPPDEVFVSARQGSVAAPPPPPLPEPERGGDESIVVTGSRIMAERENLGDLKLYRIPIPVTVASNSQKQVALLEQPQARFESFYRWRTHFSNQTEEPVPANRILRMENRKEHGLGLPLPAGTFTLFTDRRAGQPFLLGEGRMTDRAEGERVDVELDQAPGVRVTQRLVRREPNGDGEWETEITVSNDLPHGVRFEAQFNDEDKKVRSTPKLIRRDGTWWWDVNLPANGSRTLRINYGEID